MGSYGSARMIRQDVAELIRPPRRIKPSEAAAQYMKMVNGDGTVQDWSAEGAPYIREPLDCMGGRSYDAVIFAGPARTGKTQALLDGYIAYRIECDPADGLIIQISEEKAREYSKKRVDRMLNHSPALAKRLSPRGHDNNVHDRIFRAGNYLGIKWPSKNVMASSDYKFVLITDYDRLSADMGGEGDPFTLASKRTQTFGSTGMTLAESSPGRDITDPTWRQPEDAPHMAPPTTGILDLYNQGTRCRWYWQCPEGHCREWFQPIMENFNLQSARAFCPHCGTEVDPSLKKRLNLNGRWVPEGGYLNADGGLEGESRKSRIASFWMEGPAAAFQTWSSLAEKLKRARETYESTGSEHTYKAVINTDWGRPYLSQAMLEESRSTNVSDLAEDFPRFVVPENARFLIASADVQGGQDARFVVQVHAFGPHMEQWLIDRFEIRDSNRPGVGGRKAPIDPASYPEDWDILTERTLGATYRTQIKGQELRVRLVVADSGGESGVSENAKAWWLRLQEQRLGDKARIYKGGSTLTAPILRKTRVGTRKNIPQLLCNPNLLKDSVFNASRRQSGGPARLHFPTWLGAAFWDEFRAEVRQPNGKWKQIRKRNESIDLCAMIWAGALHLGADRINWDNPTQPWARPIEHNSERETREERRKRLLDPRTSKSARQGVGKSEWSSRL